MNPRKFISGVMASMAAIASAPAPTPADAARTLGAIARKNAADRRTAMLDTLRGELARGQHANLGWRA